MNRSPTIYATVHDAGDPGAVTRRIVLPRPPVAVVSPLEAVIHGWWHRSGGYPVGRVFATWSAHG